MAAPKRTTERVKIHTIITHVRPHLDEIVALWLLKKFGGTHYIGLRTAKLEFRAGDNHNTTTANTVVDLEKQGIIAIGIGHGRFDEHKLAKGVLEDQCAATLVAHFLGINDDPALKQILKYTLNNDRRSAAHPFDIASGITLLYQQYPEDPMKAINWAITLLKAKYSEQHVFFSQTVQEAQKAKITEISFFNQKIKLAVITSDDPLINKYLRSQGIAIIIQRNSSGNVQIFTNKKVATFRLFDIVRILRHEEQRRRRITSPVTDWKELAAEGMLANWYYQKEAETLLNGSLTATDVEPTILDLNFIEKAVIIGINPQLLHDSCPLKQGRQHCPRQKCPWYRWGLHRCAKARYQMNN